EEESGIQGLRVDPYLGAIHVHPVTCSLGVPTRHLDLQLIARAPERAQIAISDESLDLRWWPMGELPAGSDSALANLARVGQAR
ncbi:MAG TPA: NUDIX hydrolase, partial [Mycobacterium sp.]|nr:NUDIX hydrolase [Mycobacterium sp.]